MGRIDQLSLEAFDWVCAGFADSHTSAAEQDEPQGVLDDDGAG